MSERFIHPVLPVSRSGKVQEKKKQTDNKKKSGKTEKKESVINRKKGIIDTYA